MLDHPFSVRLDEQPDPYGSILVTEHADGVENLHLVSQRSIKSGDFELTPTHANKIVAIQNSPNM